MTDQIIDLEDECARMSGAPFDKSDKTQRAMLFLLAALEQRTVSYVRIHRRTGIDLSECREFLASAKAFKIFQGYKIAGANWFEDETGGTAFVLDSLVLSGLLERKAKP